MPGELRNSSLSACVQLSWAEKPVPFDPGAWMNLITGRLLAIAVAVVLVTANRLLEAMGLEYAFEDCAGAAFLAATVVAVAGRKS